MKKTIVVLVVLLLAFAMVIPAAAGNGSGGGGSGNGGSGTGTGTGKTQQSPRGTFAITGTIAAIGANSVTVNVVRGNKLVQPYLGTAVTVTVNAKTVYNFTDGTTTRKITFADLKVGQPVSVNGTVADNVWTTLRITVGASLTCLP